MIYDNFFAQGHCVRLLSDCPLNPDQGIVFDFST